MKKTLLILAAGMGSRFGGLKQIEGVGPNNEFIIDYSIYDAIKAGFNKIVFIIKEENYEIFKETIGKRVEPHIETEYVFQKNDNLPEEYKELLKNREKPLGTAHAILCARDKINEPFAIINADDFYGYDAYEKAIQFLENPSTNHYGMVAYRLGNTLTPNGSAKRGVCEVDEKGELIKLTESSVTLNGDTVDVHPLEGKAAFRTSKDTIASMNFLLFTPDLFQILEDRFPDFLNQNKDNLDSCEYLIPIVLNELVEEGKKQVNVIETTSVWYGITYKEDKDLVTNAIKKLVEMGVYPQNLWSE
ncbi:MAG: sugar phosphate nucleotidyltransferase [bacterium]|nr:nucleotidyltransferase [Mycoplasmatota bacterium]MDD6757245.1 sugar phosphate nucleotidyltransferase [bacterium]MDY2908554.1 sugar phosphate nucleotidyltransferase [Candidatus Faecimonas sp.]